MAKSNELGRICMETDVLIDGKWVSAYEWVTPAEQAAFVEQYESEARILANKKIAKRG